MPPVAAVTGRTLGVAFGTGVALRVESAVDVGTAVGIGRVTGVADGIAVGPASDPTIGRGVGARTGRMTGLGVGLGVGFGVGRGVGFGVGFGVGLGVAAGAFAIVTLPAARLTSLLSFARALRTTACVPSGSVPDHRNVTPLPQSRPATRVMGLAAPPIRALTVSARDPFVFW
jgi:hypothetical protein